MIKQNLELSPAEWEIMQVVWNEDTKVTVRRVLDKAYPQSEKAYTTVQTFMNILVDKGILKREKVGSVNLYYAAVSRERVLNQSFSTLAKRMFQGSFSAMASFLVNSVSLNAEELKEIKQILDDKSRKIKK